MKVADFSHLAVKFGFGAIKKKREGVPFALHRSVWT